MSSYFLAKTEPDVYSIKDLKRDQVTPWNGVRNPQAVNFIKSMQVGDLVLIYHSGGESAIQGLAKVIKNPYPASDDVRSWQVDLQFVCEFEEAMGLKEIKATGLFEDFRLVYQSRLSVMPCPQNFVDWLRKVRGWQL